MACDPEKDRAEICRRIPHRSPFLWIDRIVGLTPASIKTEVRFPADLALFQGHYPGHPLVPGVLLCEAIFQSGALLISELLEEGKLSGQGVPVLTRITNAKLKRQVRPGDLVCMEVVLAEAVGPAWFLRGKATVAGKVAVKVEFGCTFTGPEIQSDY